MSGIAAAKEASVALIPVLARGSKAVDGEVSGRTLFTRAAPETTDDEVDARPKAEGEGQSVPTLARSARLSQGHVLGRTVITATPETTDDR